MYRRKEKTSVDAENDLKNRNGNLLAKIRHLCAQLGTSQGYQKAKITLLKGKRASLKFNQITIPGA